jgi:Leucine-rich repeat (LRR) protein
VTYHNIHVDQQISSPDHPFWRWLGNREGRVQQLSLHVQPYLPQNWEKPIQLLNGIPDCQLEVTVKWWPEQEHRFARLWLGQGGPLIKVLSTCVNVGQDAWKLQDFIGAVAGCTSLQLKVVNEDPTDLDLSSLGDVRDSLELLHVCPVLMLGSFMQVRGLATVTSLSRLRELEIEHARLDIESPWAVLGSLVSLRKLALRHVYAHGDPSPLSALTGLTSLIVSKDDEVPPGYTFRTLQCLSTLQQLEELDLSNCCSATSLEGLGGLGKLGSLSISYSSELCSLAGASTSLTSLALGGVRRLSSMVGLENLVQLQHLEVADCGIASLLQLTALTNLQTLEVTGELSLLSLEGIEGLRDSLKTLRLEGCEGLQSLSGLEQQSMLQKLTVEKCGVTSLQPVSELSAVGMTQLSILFCSQVQEQVLELPHLPPTVQIEFWRCNVQQVVLAGNVKIEVQA